MRRILVGVDGSEPSGRAVDWAVQLAEKFGASLDLVHVLPPVFLASVEGYAAALEQLEKLNRRGAAQVLEQAAARARRPGLELRTEVLEGRNVADRMARAALERDADLVVVGTHGQGPVSRLLLGSVTSHLVHVCRKPVLVAR